jgi:hypothetical protein
LDAITEPAREIQHLDVEGPAIHQLAAKQILRRQAPERLEATLGVLEPPHCQELNHTIEDAAHEVPPRWLPNPSGPGGLSRPNSNIRTRLNSPG